MKAGNMVIDAQAIEHLELLEIPGRSKDKKEGSFYNFLAQKARTPFGKRLMKRWVVAPLKDSAKINDRLAAVTDLVENQMLLDKFQAKLGKLPDIERMLSKVFTYSQKSSVKAIYIDIAVLSRLDEFYALLNQLGSLRSYIEEVFDDVAIKKLQSRRLKALVSFTQTKITEKKAARKRKSSKASNEESKSTDDTDDGIFPDYKPILEEFHKMIQWKAVGNKKIPEPIKGLD